MLVLGDKFFLKTPPKTYIFLDKIKKYIIVFSYLNFNFIDMDVNKQSVEDILRELVIARGEYIEAGHNVRVFCDGKRDEIASLIGILHEKEAKLIQKIKNLRNAISWDSKYQVLMPKDEF